jgi:hypothetical protein
MLAEASLVRISGLFVRQADETPAVHVMWVEFDVCPRRSR